MLPHPYWQPASSSQCDVGLCITLTIARDFFLPPCGVRFGPCTVLWAAVPEAAVHEDCDPGGAEDQIRLATKAGYGAHVDPVTESQAVQEAAKGDFWVCVPLPLSLHRPAFGIRRWLQSSWHRASILPHGRTSG
jgi:hypothetical protein